MIKKMSSKLAITVGLIILGMGLMVGCTQVDATPVEATEESPIAVEDTTQRRTRPCEPLDDETKTDSKVDIEFDIIGQLIEIDGDKAHILFGDIVEMFTVSNASDFYLGETVKVNGSGELKTLESFITESFTIKHTSMGDMIESLEGTVVESKGSKLVVLTKSGEETFEVYDDAYFEKGANVHVDYVRFMNGNSQKTLIQVFDLDSNMKLTVQGIERTDSGYMSLKCIDEAGMESSVQVSIGTNDNFNLSDLKVEDKINVIPKVIMESYPLQIIPKRIVLEK